jgi:Papain family cysteine protease
MCTYRCSDLDYEIEKYYCKVGSLKVLTTREEIKAELRENGPLMMGLMIYEDFLNYESGVYV